MRVLNEWIGQLKILNRLLGRTWTEESYLCLSWPLKRSGLYYPITHVDDAM